jgi:hypothetical protein
MLLVGYLLPQARVTKSENLHGLQFLSPMNNLLVISLQSHEASSLRNRGQEHEIMNLLVSHLRSDQEWRSLSRSFPQLSAEYFRVLQIRTAFSLHAYASLTLLWVCVL